MILVYGAILMHLKLKLGKKHNVPHNHFADHYEIGIGGQAAIQALACVKGGERTALVGHIGDDHYGKNILLRLRQHGVITSGVARNDTVPTGSAIQLGDGKSETMIALGASEKLNHEQLPIDIMDDKTILLLQDDLPASHSTPLLPKAAEAGSRVILTCSRRAEIDQYDLAQLTYIIADEGNTDLIDTVQKSAPNKLIILRKHGACSATTDDGKTIDIPAPEIENVNWVGPTYAQETFTGVFAAGLHAMMPLPQALRRACVASALTARKKGGYRTLPYPDDIKSALEGLAK